MAAYRTKAGPRAGGGGGRKAASHLEQAPSESAPQMLGRITHDDTKRSGEQSAGNPHAPFDVAGAGNVAVCANAPAIDPTGFAA